MTKELLSVVLPMLLLGLLSSCARHGDPRPTEDAARRFVVYSLWLRGQGEEHRAELDDFQRCLLAHSNFADFWSGRVVIETGGSWVVPPPAGVLVAGEGTARWLAPLLEAASVPAPPAGVTPIYLVYAHVTQMATPMCGQCGSFSLAGRQSGIAIVRTAPSCWPAQGPVRSLTQFTQHELSCALELALGEDHCAADGQCAASAACPDPCDTFTGLYCPGAPALSYTGCDATPVRGWVVQKLSHKGEGTDACPACAPCDFTVRPLPDAGRSR